MGLGTEASISGRITLESDVVRDPSRDGLLLGGFHRPAQYRGPFCLQLRDARRGEIVAVVADEAGADGVERANLSQGMQGVGGQVRPFLFIEAVSDDAPWYAWGAFGHVGNHMGVE